jgi:hypothetical protein
MVIDKEGVRADGGQSRHALGHGMELRFGGKRPRVRLAGSRFLYFPITYLKTNRQSKQPRASNRITVFN